MLLKLLQNFCSGRPGEYTGWKCLSEPGAQKGEILLLGAELLASSFDLRPAAKKPQPQQKPGLAPILPFMTRKTPGLIAIP
jgi:hypothetical protein